MKSNSLVLILILSFTVSLYFFKQKNDKEELLIFEYYNYSILENERNELKKELNNQKYISLLLFNYSDYKKVKKDTTLQKLIFKYDNQ
tara:strand:+ start:166 stop:429 length:264 start_codon:yes stop_codon:yes gene_type:complete